MSQNNTIRKSDKKFIRTEKSRIRSQFLDTKKQQELIDSLYKKFLPQEKVEVAPDKSQRHFDGPVTIPPKADLVGEPKKETVAPKVEVKKEVKKPKTKKEKKVKTKTK